MRLRPAAAGDERAWQDLLEASPAGDFLHDWAWAEVARFDGQPQQRYVLEEDGRLTALVAVQVRRLSMGRAFWYVPHGPVMDYADVLAGARLRAVVDGLRGFARMGRAVAVRLEPRLEAGTAGAGLIGGAAGLRRVEGHLQIGYTRVVELTDDAALIASFNQNTRYSIRRSEREGVTVRATDDPADAAAIGGLYDLSEVTQRRAGFPRRPRERYELVWRQLATQGRATILEARHEERLLASAMLLIEGERSFYYLAGSQREAPGETKLFPTYALQWALMRHARDRGARLHDLWGIAPPGAGTDHPWHGVGQFKHGFGGREVAWAGMWDLVVDPVFYRLREAAAPLLALARRVRR